MIFNSFFLPFSPPFSLCPFSLRKRKRKLRKEKKVLSVQAFFIRKGVLRKEKFFLLVQVFFLSKKEKVF